MSDPSKSIAEALDYSRERLLGSLEGLTDEQIKWRPSDKANSIGSILLHLTRMHDRDLPRCFDQPEVWESEGWKEKLGFPEPEPPARFETGHTFDKINGGNAQLQQLIDYTTKVRQTVLQQLSTADMSALQKPLEQGNHPEWSGAAWLMHAALHESHHQGQIDYLKGLVQNKETAL
jgi:uncharacterized damage-inducible protein DinB